MTTYTIRTITRYELLRTEPVNTEEAGYWPIAEYRHIEDARAAIPDGAQVTVIE